MKEVKFRIWDKNKKIMYMARKITWAPQGLSPFICSLGGKPVREDEREKLFHERENPNYINLYTGECELLQFTERLDYDGKEIFEGDIVKCGEEMGEVQYNKDSAAFIILWHPNDNRKKRGADNLGSTHPSPLKYVVGNIYENPELVPKSL